MDRGVEIPWVGGENTMGKGGQDTMGRGQNTMGRGIDIPSVGGLIYHG
jgi:hypothetical protein